VVKLVTSCYSPLTSFTYLLDFQSTNNILYYCPVSVQPAFISAVTPIKQSPSPREKKPLVVIKSVFSCAIFFSLNQQNKGMQETRTFNANKNKPQLTVQCSDAWQLRWVITAPQDTINLLQLNYDDNNCDSKHAVAKEDKKIKFRV